jgi:hypothetical protein
VAGGALASLGCPAESLRPWLSCLNLWSRRSFRPTYTESRIKESPVYKFEFDSSAVDFAVPKRAYLDAHTEASLGYIATSALVFDNSASQPQILLMQRAASNSNPKRCEPQGGACDDVDPSILHTAARELLEKAGPQASRVGDLLGSRTSSLSAMLALFANSTSLCTSRLGTGLH